MSEHNDETPSPHQTDWSYVRLGIAIIALVISIISLIVAAHNVAMASNLYGMSQETPSVVFNPKDPLNKAYLLDAASDLRLPTVPAGSVNPSFGVTYRATQNIRMSHLSSMKGPVTTTATTPTYDTGKQCVLLADSTMSFINTDGLTASLVVKTAGATLGLVKGDVRCQPQDVILLTPYELALDDAVQLAQ